MKEDALVVGSILPADAKLAVTALAEAPRGCGWVELRADLLTAAEVAYVLHKVRRDVLVAVRTPTDGGRYTGDEGGRLEILVAALRAGARAVDVEAGSGAEALLATEEPDRLVLSHHGDPCTPGALADRYRSMAGRRVGRLKIVPRASSVAELAAVRDLLGRARREGRSLACFPTGRAGALGRLLACVWGSWATYGALESGAETGEGQFSVDELIRLHDVAGIGGATRRFALIGTHVRRSPSPAMHVAGYRTVGLDARYFPLELDDVGALTAAVELAGLRGFAVTMPFKEQVAARCLAADAITAAAGAVNTVVVSPEAWQGYNTDGPAAVDVLSERMDPRGARVAIAGAGGAARAAAAALAAAGARVVLFNRDDDRGAAAARASGATRRPWAALADESWDVLVNATPLGSRGERWLPDAALRGKMVVDMAYGALETPLVSAARAAGLEVVDGAGFLLAQGVRQFRILTGVAAPREPMGAAVVQWLSADVA